MEKEIPAREKKAREPRVVGPKVKAFRKFVLIHKNHAKSEAGVPIEPRDIWFHNMRVGDQFHNLTIFYAAVMAWAKENPESTCLDLELFLRENKFETMLFAADIDPEAKRSGIRYYQPDGVTHAKYECWISCRPSLHAVAEIVLHYEKMYREKYGETDRKEFSKLSETEQECFMDRVFAHNRDRLQYAGNGRPKREKDGSSKDSSKSAMEFMKAREKNEYEFTSQSDRETSAKVASNEYVVKIERYLAVPRTLLVDGKKVELANVEIEEGGGNAAPQQKETQKEK